MRTRTGAGFALALLAYTALVLLLFRGLFGQFSTAVPHDLGDPLLSTWILWWNAHRVPFVGSWWDGLSFFPAPGALALSDHRVGLMWLAGPVQWLGGTPVLAYNVTLLGSFVLCALAAHALTWVLTRSHAAGAVSGLVFGFNPYRISHIAHLELLVVFWLPLAMLALHRYIREYQLRWLALFAVCWLMQGLSSGYYLFYSAPLVGLWALWFARDRPWRGIGAILLSCAAVVVALLPVLLEYRTIQDQLHLTRSFAEIQAFSADVTGLLSATPIMALWRFPSLASGGEGEIYLGVFAPLLMLAGFAGRPRTPIAAGGRGLHALRLGVASVCVVYALIAAGTLIGPWTVSLGPLKISATQTGQPISIAILCLLILGATSAAFIDAVQRRSIFAFYTVAALVTWLFALGPRPKLLGQQLLYRGPYDLLMLFPGFDERLRVPARFVMITILAVAVAAGIGLVRITAAAPWRKRLVAVVLALFAIISDSWTFACPMPVAPPFLQLPAGVPDSAAVLELPLGDVGSDIGTVYGSIGHGHPVVNGYSGYAPLHYGVLKAGLTERDDSALTTLTRFAPIVVVIQSLRDADGRWAAFAAAHPGAVRLAGSAGQVVYLLPASANPPRAAAVTWPIRGATANREPFDPQLVTDGNVETHWVAATLSARSETIVLELDDVHSVNGLSLSTGPRMDDYPRGLAVATSVDGMAWQDVWAGGIAGPIVEGILENPRAVEGRVEFPATQARFIQLRHLNVRPHRGWVIAEAKVYGTR